MRQPKYQDNRRPITPGMVVRGLIWFVPDRVVMLLGIALTFALLCYAPRGSKRWERWDRFAYKISHDGLSLWQRRKYSKGDGGNDRPHLSRWGRFILWATWEG